MSSTWGSHVTTLNDGTKVPTLAFGTGTALFGKDADQAVAQAISQAGYRHIDCAEVYANHISVGKAIRESGVPRSELFITSKCISPDPRKSLEKILGELELPFLDLYLIHSPTATPDHAAAWQTMEQLKEEGKVKSIGVSNFRVKDLQTILKVAKVKPSVNQIEFHPYVLKSTIPILSLCEENDIKIECYGPLTSLIRHKGGPVDESIKNVASRMSKGEGGLVTEGQVLLKWAEQRSGGIIVTTSSKVDRLLEQKAALDLPPLSNDELRSIEEAGVKVHYRHFMKHMDE